MDIRLLLPPSTNDAYRGSPLSVWFLMLASALTIVPGLIHYALPDGGAGVIAGDALYVLYDSLGRAFAAPPAPTGPG